MEKDMNLLSWSSGNAFGGMQNHVYTWVLLDQVAHEQYSDPKKTPHGPTKSPGPSRPSR